MQATILLSVELHPSCADSQYSLYWNL